MERFPAICSDLEIYKILLNWKNAFFSWVYAPYSMFKCVSVYVCVLCMSVCVCECVSVCVSVSV